MTNTAFITAHYINILIIEIVVIGGNVIQSFVSAGEVHPDLREVSRHFLASQQLTAERIVRILIFILVLNNIDVELLKICFCVN